MSSALRWLLSSLALLWSLEASPQSPARDHEHGQVEEHAEGEPQEGLSAKLYELDRQVLALITRREEVRKSLLSLTPTLKQKRAELASLEREVAAQRLALARALTLRRRLKGSKVAELLLSSSGPLELKRRELSLAVALKAGAKELISMTRSQQALKCLSQELSEREGLARQLKGALSQQVDQLLILRAEEARLLNQGEGEVPEVTQGAKLLPPTLGLWEDRFQSYRAHKLAKLYGHGVLIKARRGAPVYAVEYGEVIFVGWLRNRGGVIIISHPSFMGLERIQSVYVGLKPTARVGQRIGRQELIGALSPEREGSGLSFELRQGLRPIYPRRWINEVALKELSDD